MTVFQFGDGAHVPKGLDPQAIGERIEHLKESEGVGFKPASVVRDARPAKSPLHGAFTWDDKEAAEAYRLQQAGHLIRSIVRIMGTEEAPRQVRAFVSVTVRDVDEQRYVDIEVAMSDADYRRQVLETALNEMIALRRKYQDLEELARIFKAIDETAKKLRAA